MSSDEGASWGDSQQIRLMHGRKGHGAAEAHETAPRSGNVLLRIACCSLGRAATHVVLEHNP